MKKAKQLLETNIWLVKEELKVATSTNEIQHLNSRLLRLEKIQTKF